MISSTTPFPHVVIEGFLPRQDAAKALAALRATPMERKEADLFSFAQTRELKRSNDPGIKRFLERLWTDGRAHAETLYGRKLRSIDAGGFTYSLGDHLLCHDDGVSSRKVAYIYYLNSMPARDGGALALYGHDTKHRPTKVVKRIAPRANTLLLFTVSEDSHHAVEEVLRGERHTITGWFHA
jgi:phosphatidylinositol glycan class S